MALHELDLKTEPNRASSLRSNSCSAVDKKKPCLSTFRSKSEVPSPCECYGSTQDEGSRIAPKQQICEHTEDRKQKPLGGPQEVQGLSRSGPGTPGGLRVPPEESPPPEIISVRKVQHTRPTKPIHVISNHKNIRTTSSSLQHPPPSHQHNQISTHPKPPPPTCNVGNKRQRPQVAEIEKKRQKTTFSNGSPEGDSGQTHFAEPDEYMGLSKQTHTCFEGSSFSPPSAHAKQSTSLAGAHSNTDLVASAVYSSVLDNSATHPNERMVRNEVTKTPNPETGSKRWTPESWTTCQYVNLAEQAWRSFPVEDFMQQHNKTFLEVREVFMGIVRLPALAQTQRSVGLPRGGLGEERMKEFRKKEKEAVQASREEAAEEKLTKEGKSPAVPCEGCKKKAVKPTTKAEASTNMATAFNEYTKATKLYERLAAKEIARASKTTERPKKRAAKGNANVSK